MMVEFTAYSRGSDFRRGPSINFRLKETGGG